MPPGGTDPSAPGATVPPTPPPVAAPPRASWLRRNLGLVVAGAGVIGLATVAALAVALVLRPGASVGRLIPSSADVYVSVALDPSVTQKMNLVTLAHQFPDLKTDADINRQLNDSLKAKDLSFTSDVQPWLGREVGVMVQLTDKTATAVVILSRDDAKAQAALGKLRTGKWGQKQSWKDQTYAGITISLGTPLPGGAKEPTAYAYVDHAVVVANTDTLIREIIDTDQGKHPRLIDSPVFKATVSQLPSDRLALLYVNGGSVVSRVKDELKKDSTMTLTLPQGSLDQLSAFTSLGFTVSAKSNGIAGDLQIQLDDSKLDAATRQALNVPSHKNATLSWVPQHSYGLLAVIGLNRGLQQAVDKWTASDSQTVKALTMMGFTGPDGALAHLTGDGSLEFGGDTQLASGALLIGTDDEASLRRFLTSFMGFAAQGTASSPGSQRVTVKNQTYHGVTMTTITEPELALYGVSPTVAVTGGVGIMASSPQETKALIDAHAQGHGIATAANFSAGSREIYSDYVSLFYLDVGEFSTALRNFFPSSDWLQLDAQLGKATPVKAIMVAAQVASDRLSERIFVLIDSTSKT